MLGEARLLVEAKKMQAIPYDVVHSSVSAARLVILDANDWHMHDSKVSCMLSDRCVHII